MKSYVTIALLFFVGCASQPVQSTYRLPQPEVLPHADWSKTPPEQFDWQNYVGEALSTADTMERAYYGIEVLQKRMDVIFRSHRQRLALNPEQLRRFDEMQSRWEKLASLETTFVADGWRGGSGQKAIWPTARLRLLQSRVLRLLELKNEALDLNE